MFNAGEEKNLRLFICFFLFRGVVLGGSRFEHIIAYPCMRGLSPFLGLMGLCMHDPMAERAPAVVWVVSTKQNRLVAKASELVVVVGSVMSYRGSNVNRMVRSTGLHWMRVSSSLRFVIG